MRLLKPNSPEARPTAIDDALRQAARTLGDKSPDLILVNDPQRATASREVLARARAFIDLTRARVLVATGSHRFSETERRAFAHAYAGMPLGEWDWHDARVPGLVPIGGATGWRAHSWLAQAERILAIGSVEPHYFAGFTGAHKTVTIGCAAYADIERNHAGAMDPACRPCRLEGTPVHEGICAMLADLEKGRRVAAVNLLQLGDTVVDASGGRPLDALAALAPKVEDAYLRRIPHPARALVAEVAGPLAVSFYQAEKGIKNSEWAVRDGGVIVLQAACPQGIGQAAFVELLRDAATYAEAAALVRRHGYRLGDHKAVHLRYLTDPACRGVRVFAVAPGLSPADASVLGVTKADSVDNALRQADVDPDDPDVYRVEDAGNTCVECPQA